MLIISYHGNDTTLILVLVYNLETVRWNPYFYEIE